MITLNNANINDYAFFFFTDKQGVDKLEIFTSDGYKDYPHYEVIDTPNGSLIGIKERVIGVHNLSYVHDNQRFYVQTLEYQQYKHALGLEKLDNYSLFTFTRSQYIDQNSEHPWLKDLAELMNRCDFGYYGPFAMYPNVKPPYNVKQINNILDIAGVGHIIHFITDGYENEYPLTRTQNVSAPTFASLLKQLWEWSEVTKEPFNSTEDAAVLSKNFIDGLNMGDDVWDEILTTQPKMKIARYLEGETRLAYKIDAPEVVPPLFHNFVKTTCVYKTLFSIKANHPNGSLISDNHIALEKDFLDTEIYRIQLNNGIDFDDQESLDSFMKENFNSKSKIVCLYEEYK